MAKIIVKDEDGVIIADFDDNQEESIGVQAQEEGAPIPFSCGSGACRTCVAQVCKGKEHINEEFIGQKYIVTEDDEILTCISGIKDDAPDDAEIELRCNQI